MVISKQVLDVISEKDNRRVYIIQKCNIHHKVFKIYIDPRRFRIENISEQEESINMKSIKNKMRKFLDNIWHFYIPQAFFLIKDIISLIVIFSYSIIFSKLFLVIGLICLLIFNSNSNNVLKEIIHEATYFTHFCSSLISFFLHIPNYQYSSIPLFNNKTLIHESKYSGYSVLNYNSNYNKEINIKTTSGNYCHLLNHQFNINDNNIYNNFSTETDTFHSKNECEIPQIKSQSHFSNVDKEYLLDFSEIIKKLDNIHGTLNHLDHTYTHLHKHIINTKKSHQIIHHTLEGYSLEIYNLYKKINRLEEQLIYTIHAKSEALDYKYKKNLERDERILKILYDHMTELYNTQISFIDQVNSIYIYMENNSNTNSQQQIATTNTNLYINNNDNNLQTQNYIKRKYILLRQEMNKYKMILSIFELPLNLIIQNDSIIYFDDFLQFIKNENKNLAKFINTFYQNSSFDNKKICQNENTNTFLHNSNEMYYCNKGNNINKNKDDNDDDIDITHPNELNLIYELYQIYHERFLKLKQENIKENQDNDKLFKEVENMKIQIENVYNIIKILNSNQEKLENKLKSIEQLITLSSSSTSNSSLQSLIYDSGKENIDWICPFNSPDFINYQLSSDLSITISQCPVFNNELINLIYQFVMKKIQETDYGINIPDYALKSSGGYIVYSHTSPSFIGEIRYNKHYHHNNKENRSFIKTLLSKYLITSSHSLYSSANLILDPHILPGYGWSMNGPSGYITIGLAKPIYPKSFTIDHLPENLNIEPSTSSAPRYIEVIGIYDLKKFKLNQIKTNNENKKYQRMGKNSNGNEDENNNEIILIPVFEFNPTLSSSITVPVPENIYLNIKKPISYIHVKILSNWGNNDYTTIYRLRIH